MESGFQSKLNFFEFFILFFLMFELLIGQEKNKKINEYKEPYITAIFVGQGKKETVNVNSYICPDRAFMTKTHSIMIMNSTYKDYYININNENEENNITLEFSSDDSDLSYLFKNLSHIKKVDLSHYKVKVTDLSSIFEGCINLEEVIFGDFDTSKVTTMASMFKDTLVTSLDLSKFTGHKVSDTNNMFNNCQNLKYLNLKNFKFSKVIDANNMFDGCLDSLIYLNIYSNNDDDYMHFDRNLLENINNTEFTICINVEQAPELYELVIKKNIKLNCSYLSEDFPKNIDEYQEKTRKNETNTPTLDTKDISENITENCTSIDFFNGKCEKEENEEIISIEEKDNKIKNIIDDIENRKLDSILNTILSGEEEDFIINQKDISYQLTTTENQLYNEYNNISSINLGKCEEILKEIYSINNDTALIILKVDYYMEDFKIPVIGYEVFHPVNKTKLNLSHCNNVTISYNIPVDIDEDDLDKYNTSSDYYNDECSVYTTDDGTDIIILDRKKEFNENNMFLCENNCNYTNYNSTSKKSQCICEVKSKIYSISDIIDNKEKF